MTIKCKSCNAEYEIVETGNNMDVSSVCPSCGVENKGSFINGEYHFDETEKKVVKPLNLAAKIIRWFIGVILMIILLDYIFNILESGSSDKPFLYYAFAFIAGLSLIPPMRSKTNPGINLLVFLFSMILSIVMFYVRF